MAIGKLVWRVTDNIDFFVFLYIALLRGSGKPIAEFAWVAAKFFLAAFLICINLNGVLKLIFICFDTYYFFVLKLFFDFF